MQHNDSQPTQKDLTKAFRIDCQAIITRFELSYNINFQNFCEIWRDMQFSLIFDYFPTETALIAFCKKALCISKQFLINASSLKERIGALYLLYGIYYKMPTKQLKIRITLSDWNCVMEFHKQLKNDEYLDANYILCKLIIDNAFMYCIGDNEYGIEKHSYRNLENPVLDVNLMPEIKNLAEPNGLLSTINKLSKIYEEKKNSLNNEKESGLQLYDSKMANDIIENIRTMQSKNRIFNTTDLDMTNANCTKSLSTESSVLDVDVDVDAQKSQKRSRFRKEKVLAKIGRAFEKGLRSDDSE